MTEEIISRGHPRAHARGVLWYGVNALGIVDESENNQAD